MTDLFPATHELITLGRTLGSHPGRYALWNEGAVGALLPEGKIAVSAVGTELAKLDQREIIVMDHTRACGFLECEHVTEEDLVEAGVPADGPLPCADIFAFADLLTFEGVSFAAHTQPTPVNQIVASPRARQFSDRRNLPHEILACGAASVLVPFAPPGLPLAREIRRKITLWQDRFKGAPQVILLQNHGMIALGDSVEEVIMRTEMTVKYAEIFIGAAMMGGPEFLKPIHVSHIEATRFV